MTENDIIAVHSYAHNSLPNCINQLLPEMNFLLAAAGTLVCIGSVQSQWGPGMYGGELHQYTP